MAILTNPTGVATGQTTADGTVTTDTGAGFVWFVVTQSAVAPSPVQMSFGLDDQGNPADDAGASPLLAFPGVVDINASGLTPATTYWFHFMHEINVFNRSLVVTSPSFTTDAAPMASWSRRHRSRNAFTRGNIL